MTRNRSGRRTRTRRPALRNPEMSSPHLVSDVVFGSSQNPEANPFGCEQAYPGHDRARLSLSFEPLNCAKVFVITYTTISTSWYGRWISPGSPVPRSATVPQLASNPHLCACAVAQASPETLPGILSVRFGTPTPSGDGSLSITSFFFYEFGLVLLRAARNNLHEVVGG
jgi:hypothetical protein